MDSSFEWTNASESVLGCFDMLVGEYSAFVFQTDELF